MLCVYGENPGENLWITCGYRQITPRPAPNSANPGVKCVGTPVLEHVKIAVYNQFQLCRRNDLANQPDNPLGDIQMDVTNLYREENFTDLKVGSLRRLTPVTADGAEDPSRSVIFMGQAQLMSQMGPLPVSCEIEAASLQDAIDQFPAAIQKAVEQMIEEVKEMQREQASQIVVPSAAPGGNIQLR